MMRYPTVSPHFSITPDVAPATELQSAARSSILHAGVVALAITLLLLVLGPVRPAGAVLCALDVVPAATLLVPYFEVDLDDCGSRDTVVTILNSEPTNTLVHVTVWTDWGEPSLDFDIYLTGYDREDFSLAAAFCNGSLPVTGPTVSHHGELSEGPELPPSCLNVLPYPDPVIPAGLLDRMVAFHTGQPYTQTQTCFGSDHGDNVARGWITIDVSKRCSLEFPSDAGYFDEFGTAGFENRLLGEILYTDSVSGETAMLPAVHLESDIDQPTFAPGDHTFYGSIAEGLVLAVDRREPLPTTYGLRAVTGETSDLVIWREAHIPGTGSNQGVTCGTTPQGLPLAENPLFAFDDEENPVLATASSIWMTQRTPLVLPAGIGWLRFDGRHDGVQEIYGDDRAQAWVGKLVRLGVGGQRLATPAHPLDSTCSP